MNAVIDSIHAQLSQLRSKLDEFPALQRLEVRNRNESLEYNIMKFGRCAFCAADLEIYYLASVPMDRSMRIVIGMWKCAACCPYLAVLVHIRIISHSHPLSPAACSPNNFFLHYSIITTSTTTRINATFQRNISPPVDPFPSSSSSSSV